MEISEYLKWMDENEKISFEVLVDIWATSTDENKEDVACNLMKYLVEHPHCISYNQTLPEIQNYLLKQNRTSYGSGYHEELKRDVIYFDSDKNDPIQFLKIVKSGTPWCAVSLKGLSKALDEDYKPSLKEILVEGKQPLITHEKEIIWKDAPPTYLIQLAYEVHDALWVKEKPTIGTINEISLRQERVRQWIIKNKREKKDHANEWTRITKGDIEALERVTTPPWALKTGGHVNLPN